MKKIIIVLLSAILMGSILSCGLFSSLNTKAFDESPLAPEIVSGTAGARALVASADQDFGAFGMIKNSATNYNSMILGNVPDAHNQLEFVASADTSVGSFIRKWENDISSYYENEDGSVATTMNAWTESEIRQFDSFIIADTKGTKYSRCLFFWPEGSDMESGVDVTEVWEYTDYKEVSVTMYNKQRDNVRKYLAITDMSGELQKTSMLEYEGEYPNENVDITEYLSIGYIDFERTIAAQASLSEHSGAEDAYLTSYPSFAKLSALHAKSVTFAEAKAVNIDRSTLEPFTGFIDRSELF